MVHDIRNTTFDRVKKGYSPEDVDAFLQEIAFEVERLTEENKRLSAEKTQTEENMYVLATKLEEYRDQENALRGALINAQRMGESIVQEAKRKAEQMMRDATAKAERVVEATSARADREERAFAKMRRDISTFRNTVLELYKEHIDLLSSLPEEEAEETKTAEQAGFDYKAAAGETEYATYDGETVTGGEAAREETLEQLSAAPLFETYSENDNVLIEEGNIEAYSVAVEAVEEEQKTATGEDEAFLQVFSTLTNAEEAPALIEEGTLE